jgi:hypothetical protein
MKIVPIRDSSEEQNNFNRFQSYLVKYKTHFIIFLSFLLFIISFHLYIKSLEGCYEPMYICVQKISFFFYIGYLVFFSAALMSIILEMAFFFKKWYFILYFLPFITNFIKHHNNNLIDHGFYNIFGFIFFLIFDFLLIKIIQIFIFLIKKKKYINILIFILLNLIIYLLIKKYRNSACNNYYKGFGEYKLNNNKEENACYIIKPKKCDIPILSGLIDYSFFINSCENRDNDKKSFINYLKKYNKNLNFSKNEFYFPITTEFGIKNFRENVGKNMRTEKIEGINDQLSLKFKNNKGYFEINLKYNETLVSERRFLAKNFPVKYENIFIIYIDSLSRNHFMRKLKKTGELIDYLIRNRNSKLNKKKYDQYKFDKKVNAFQFFKYISFKGYTPYNYIPMFYGSNSTNIKKYKNFLEIAAKRGFITARTNGLCSKEPVDFTFSKVDYENSGIFCDPHFRETPLKRNCFYGKDSNDYLFEFSTKFLELYKNERKIVSLYSNDAHEGTFQQIKYIDNSLHNFLIEILTKYFNDKSIIFLMSDHGNGMPGIYDILRSEDKKIEILFGFFFLILPKNSIYTENLIINEQKMMTPYDIYGTFIDIIYSDYEEKKYPESFKGQSIFNKINGKERTCNNYYEFIKFPICACQNY